MIKGYLFVEIFILCSRVLVDLRKEQDSIVNGTESNFSASQRHYIIYEQSKVVCMDFQPSVCHDVFIMHWNHKNVDDTLQECEC